MKPWTDDRYYRLKSGLLEAALLEEQARNLRQLADQRRVQAFVDAGLNPARTYVLDDVRRRAIAQSVKPKTSAPVVTPPARP